MEGQRRTRGGDNWEKKNGVSQCFVGKQFRSTGSDPLILDRGCWGLHVCLLSRVSPVRVELNRSRVFFLIFVLRLLSAVQLVLDLFRAVLHFAQLLFRQRELPQ